MHYRIIPPPASLQSVIRYLWVLESNAVIDTPQTFSPLADGCPGILFQHSHLGNYYDSNNQPMPGIFLYGQTIAPMQLRSTGRLQTVGVIFHPHALQSVFGMHAPELTGACVDLNWLNNKKEKFLYDKLLHAGSTQQQVTIITDYLLSLMQQKGNMKEVVTQAAVRTIWQQKGHVSLKELLQQLRVPERSFERKFKQMVGVSPKLFARICRFQEALTQLRNNNYHRLSDIAYDNGYADQSHFIRSFKEFTGLSPLDYKKQVNEVAENFPVMK